jgi:phosphinothricin acetyltransferase
VWRERAAYQWTAEVGLYVDPTKRGRRYGTALYEELLTLLRMHGFRSAVAGITLPNDASIALHKKFGFDHVGTFADAGWKLDAWHAVDWWQKRFQFGAIRPLWQS